MLNQYNAEKDSWTFGDLDYAVIGPRDAAIGNDAYDYGWNITEDEL